jgi:hypothetical protein
MPSQALLDLRPPGRRGCSAHLGGRWRPEPAAAACALARTPRLQRLGRASALARAARAAACGACDAGAGRPPCDEGGNLRSRRCHMLRRLPRCPPGAGRCPRQANGVLLQGRPSTGACRREAAARPGSGARSGAGSGGGGAWRAEPLLVLVARLLPLHQAPALLPPPPPRPGRLWARAPAAPRGRAAA